MYIILYNYYVLYNYTRYIKIFIPIPNILYYTCILVYLLNHIHGNSFLFEKYSYKI